MNTKMQYTTLLINHTITTSNKQTNNNTPCITIIINTS